MKIKIIIENENKNENKIEIKMKNKNKNKNKTKTKNKWGYKGIQTKKGLNGPTGTPSGRALRGRPPGDPSRHAL